MATLTINTTAEQDVRIAKAFGYLLSKEDDDGNPVDATGPEVRARIIDFIRDTVLHYERMEAKRAAIDNVQDIEI